ncbi:MAG TPA: hypothetical protein VK076_06075 [Candidatus Sphingobacterium stercoripullorum]|nr:hypothetical protein [Candidatus Sphingobacterium stercoripullorum]
MKEKDFTNRELVRKGELEKPLYEMTEAEKEQWYKEIPEKVRAYLFSIGQPLVYKNEKGEYIAEHSDGRVQVLED